MTVVLKARTDANETSADCYLVEKGVADLWEMKRLDESAVNVKNFDEPPSATPSGRAGGLIYHIPRDISGMGGTGPDGRVITGLDALNRGVGAGLLNDRLDQMKEILLLWYDGGIERLTVERYNAGLRFQGLSRDD